MPPTDFLPYYTDSLSVIAAGEVQAGDYIVCDPIFGMETVEEVDGTPLGDDTRKFKLAHYGQDGVQQIRYVLRHRLEPIVKVAI